MVHLLSFTGNKTTGGAQVAWTTENEQNYTNFTVERSTDGGATFSVLGGFASDAAGSYGLLDKQPLTGPNIYRLKMQDLNGTITYSNIITLIYDNAPAADGNNIVVYPNPAINTINLQIGQAGYPALNSQVLHGTGIETSFTSNSNAYTIKIVNVSGSVIQTASSSSTAWQSNVSSLLPGTYIVQVLSSASNKLVGKTTFVKL